MRRTTVVCTVLASAGALVLSACSVAGLELRTVAATVSASAAAINVAAGRADARGQVSPDRPIVVTVAAGRLTTVAVNGPDGPLMGTMSSDSRTWTSTSDGLTFSSTYLVKASAVDRLGVATKTSKKIITLKPSALLNVDGVNPSGQNVGIGFPMKVTLSKSVSPDYRTKVESRLSVSANGKPIVGGAWRWDTDSVLRYRPPAFWPGNATIALNAKFKGVNFGKNTWGEKDSERTWTTAAANIYYVDLSTHQMRVTQNGKTLRIIPVTGGKAGFETRNGVKVILMKEPTRRMDAATGGTPASDPNYYNLVVLWAMRMTWSGEFLHAAPWSVGSQGRANVSHGCTGMSTANAAWLYSISHIGDLAIYVGGKGIMGPGNGVNDWNIPLKAWAAGADA